MNNYINTAASDVSQARTVGLSNLLPEPFPAFFAGTSPALNFFFANRGVMEAFSGDAGYTLRLTLADAIGLPVSGTFSITTGTDTALTLPYDIDAAGLEAALNTLATVISEGYVDVLGLPAGDTANPAAAPRAFLISHRTTGVKTGFTVDGALLTPDCTPELSVLTTGASGVRQLTAFTLRRNPLAQKSNWSTISTPNAGWSGALGLNTPAALEFIRTNGRLVGAYLQAETLLTIDVLDANNNVTPYYQGPVTLRALNYDTVANTSNISGNTTTYYFSKPSVIGLAAAAIDPTKLGGLSTNAAQYPVQAVIQLCFTGDVVCTFIRKASTAAQNVPFLVRPYDYNASTNAYQWVLDRVSKQGVPCTYDADTGLWHYIVAEGAANAVTLATDQTGFALPS